MAMWSYLLTMAYTEDWLLQFEMERTFTSRWLRLHTVAVTTRALKAAHGCGQISMTPTQLRRLGQVLALQSSGKVLGAVTKDYGDYVDGVLPGLSRN